MDIAGIDATLRAQLSNPHVVLGPDTFGQDPVITPLLQQYFSASAGNVTIGGVTAATYQYDATAGVITLSGVAAGGPFDSSAVDVTIQVSAGTPQLAIQGPLPDGWKLCQGFPDLRSPIIQLLPFQQAALYWASFDDNDAHAVGYYFEGNVDFTQRPLSFLRFLFPSASGPRIWGQIQMVGSTGQNAAQYRPEHDPRLRRHGGQRQGRTVHAAWAAVQDLRQP